MSAIRTLPFSVSKTIRRKSAEQFKWFFCINNIMNKKKTKQKTLKTW